MVQQCISSDLSKEQNLQDAIGQQFMRVMFQHKMPNLTPLYSYVKAQDLEKICFP